MKKFIITITLLVALVGSAFATNWKKYKTFEDDIGHITVYIDTDAREPYKPGDEGCILHFLYLLSKYDDALFFYLDTPEDYDYARLSIEISKKHKTYRTLILTEKYELEYRVCCDGTVIKYMYTRRSEYL